MAHFAHRPVSESDRPRFCTGCGGSLGDRQPHGGWDCGGCGSPTFLDPKVAACAVPWWEDKLVLVKRAIEPRRGFWASPGGYCERGEPPAIAAARETFEETGLAVRATNLLGVYAYAGSPVIVIYYDCELVSDGDGPCSPPRPLDECLEVGLFAPDEIPWSDLAFPSVHEGLAAAVASRRASREPGHRARLDGARSDRA